MATPKRPPTSGNPPHHGDRRPHRHNVLYEVCSNTICDDPSSDPRRYCPLWVAPL
ncbi:hypothetical protein LguiA_029801 [Lonicera macranthoides]